MHLFVGKGGNVKNVSDINIVIYSDKINNKKQNTFFLDWALE